MMMIRVEGKEGENKEVLKELKEKLDKRTEELETLEDSLPRKNDLYLRIILDGINVSFVDQEQRFNFKEQYEKFKLIVSGLILFVAILDLIFKYRFVFYLMSKSLSLFVPRFTPIIER